MQQALFDRKAIWRLIIPLTLEQILTQLMGTVDTMMVSCAGSAAISAVSLVDSINVLIQYVFVAMATGGCIICAQYLGRHDADRASEIGKQMVLTVTVLSGAVMFVLLFLRRPVLRLIFGQVEDAVMENAQIYMLFTAISYPFLALYNVGAALFRVQGNVRLPLAVSTISNLVNIAGNAVLIFGFQMGAAGAAIATLASRMLCAIVIMICIGKPKQKIVIRDYRLIRPDWQMIRDILRVGIPAGVENGMFHFGKLAIQSSVSTLGTVAIAANAMTATMESLSSTPPNGAGLAMMTVVGQCMGAGRAEEAKHHIRSMTGIAEIMLAGICAILALMVEPVTRWAGMEPEAAKLTVYMVRWFCVIKPLMWVFSFIFPYGMRAAGDVRFSMIASSLTMWFCRVILTTVLIRVFHFGPMSVWIGMFSDWTLRATIYLLRFRSGKWTRHQVLRD